MIDTLDSMLQALNILFSTAARTILVGRYLPLTTTGGYLPSMAPLFTLTSSVAV